MKVSNMTNLRGNVVANQFIIFNGKKQIFQSYNSTIAEINYKTGKTRLDKTYWDYSVTTGRYRNQFLGENKAETQKKIDSGEYKLVNLN